MLNCDRRLSVRMLSDECNILKSTVYRIVAEDLGTRQICAVTHRLQCHGVLSETRFGNTAPATVQPLLGATGLLLVPGDQDGAQGPPFRDFGRRQKSDDEVLEEDSRQRLRGSVQLLGKTLAPVFRRERKLFWIILDTSTFICNKYLFFPGVI